MVTSASVETRGRILSAAVDAVLRVGAAGLRVDAVAQAARVNKRMIYHHFNDKEGLIQAVYVQQAQRIRAAAHALQPASWRILEDLIAHWEPLSSVPESPVSVEQLRQALVILLPVMMRRIPEPGAMPTITPVQWATFTLDVVSLAFIEIAEDVFSVKPGEPAFHRVCERLLRQSKPRYRISSDSRAPAAP